MKAMILAGGMSTRLYPLTKQVPKPLVPVAGEANAIHLIRYLAKYGYDDIAINVHYLADEIVGALGDGSRFGVRIAYLHEDVLLGSAGAVKQMEGFLSGESFVVVGCDDLTDIPLDNLLAFHAQKNALATIGLVERDEVEQYGVVVTDASNRIVGFQEKPPKGTEKSRLVNTGIYAFTPGIFKHIPSGEFYDFGKNVFPALQEAGAGFYGFDARGAYWCDIGTPDEYRRASLDVVNEVFEIPHTRGQGADPSAQIADTKALIGNVWIGKNARIERGATILGPSVIGDDAIVGEGVTIERSILWQGTRIGRSAVVQDSIIGKNYTVPENAILINAVLAND